LVQHTEEYGCDKELSTPEPLRSTVVDGAAVVDRMEIGAQVRKSMRSVPQPVSIITSTDISTGTPVFRGATISSFNTVTINPTTIISLNIKRPSSTFDAVESSGYFLVHLLRADEINSEVAQAFTKGNSTAPFRTIGKVSQVRLPEVTAHAAKADAGPPLIEDCASPGHLLCRYLPQKTVQLGDHVVVFGTVDSVIKRPNALKGSDTTCLIYANGQYGRVSSLQLSPAPTISSTAFDEFVLKLRYMDHSCLHVPISSAMWELLGPKLKASIQVMRFRSSEIFRLLTSYVSLKSEPNPSSIDLESGTMSPLSSGILKVVTFYHIFLASTSPTASMMSIIPYLPVEAGNDLQRYQKVADETSQELVAIRDSLQRIYDPQGTYQPPVSDVYSLREVPSINFGDRLRYLESYARCCLVPLSLPETPIGPRSALSPLLSQYNHIGREILQWTCYQAYHADNAFATQSNPAHDQARTAVMRIHQKDILLSWVDWPARKAGRLQRISEGFQGIDDELMLWLRQYGEMCERTAEYLNSYKAFLHASDLYNYWRDELGRSKEDGPIRTVAQTVPRKWFGRFLKPKKYATKKPPLIKRYMRYDGKGITRKVPGPLVVRKAVVGPSPNEPAEGHIRVKFMDPLARRIDLAERQEEGIQKGLGDIERLMAEKMLQRPPTMRINAQGRRQDPVNDELEDIHRSILNDQDSPKAQPKSSTSTAAAKEFFEVMGGKSKSKRG
jgi:flavin reductase (DIM6/NTAB) family NADH-FMN oxidoreductase RutF